MLKPRLLFLWFLIAGAAFLFQYSLGAYAVLAQTESGSGVAERQRGIELYRARNFVESAKVLKDVVKQNSGDDEAWYYLGLALTQQPKELKDATKAFETAIKLKPNSAAAHAGLSYALLRRNKFSEALSAAQTSLKIEPAIANAHYVVSVVRLNAGAYDEALAAANEAIRLNSKLAAAYLVKSEALWGLYAGPVDNSPRELTRFPSRTVPAQETPLTAEQKEEHRRKVKEAEALLRQSAESLETYLKLNPAEPSADRWQAQLATLKAISNIGEDGHDAVKYGGDVTTKARVLAKPEPQYTDEARRAGIRGRVVLRAIFGSDGRVHHILVIKGLPMGLSWQAIEAARRIRFTPAAIDGKPVSMFVQLEYFFNLY